MNALTSFALPRLRQGFNIAGYLALSSRPHFVALVVMATFPAMVLWDLSIEATKNPNPSGILFVITLFMIGILFGLIGHVFNLICGPSLTKGRIAFLSGILEHAGVRRKTAELLTARLKTRAALSLLTGAVGAACSRGARTSTDRLKVMRYLAAQDCSDADEAGWFAVANRRELKDAMKGIARCAVGLDDMQALPLVEALMEIEQLASVENRDPAMTGELIKTAHFMQDRAVDMLTTQQESLRVAAEPALRQRVQALRQLVMTDGEGA